MEELHPFSQNKKNNIFSIYEVETNQRSEIFIIYLFLIENLIVILEMCNFLQFIPFMVFRMGFRPKMCVLCFAELLLDLL